MDEAQHRKYTGVSNRIVKKNLLTLVTAGRRRDVVLRFPVITGINDTEENIEDFVSFVKGLDGIREVDLLPYHDVSEKYRRLGVRYEMNTHVAPGEEKLNNIKDRLEEIGLKVSIRG
jgi:pyruvate formate lyase activating enzyme